MSGTQALDEGDTISTKAMIMLYVGMPFIEKQTDLRINFGSLLHSFRGNLIQFAEQ